MDILQSISLLYDSVPIKGPKLKKMDRNALPDSFLRSPMTFFDGAAQRNSCGCGVYIIINEHLYYRLSQNAGLGTNSMAEAKALVGLLAFCVYSDIRSISIFGDSKSMVDHVNGNSLIRCPHLAGWMNRIMFFGVSWKAAPSGTSTGPGTRQRTACPRRVFSLARVHGPWRFQRTESLFSFRTSAFRVSDFSLFVLMICIWSSPF